MPAVRWPVLVVLVVAVVADRPSPPPNLVRAMESRLLRLFGMTSRPRPPPSPLVPTFMMDLYRKQQQSTDAGVHFPLRHTKAANTVRSFPHVESAADQRYSSNRFRFRFNVSSVPASDKLEAAELRLLRKGLKQALSTPAAKQRVNVYDVLRPMKSGSEPVLRLLDTRLLNPQRTKWESFDVLPAVQRWHLHPSANHGLLVKVTGQDGEQVEHVRLRRNASSNDRTWAREQPVLLVYSDDGHAKTATSKRTKRSPEPRKSRRKGHRDNCRRHSLYVDFSDVGWNDWIVAPPGYQAFYCHGECPFPLADHLNSTNHAIVQTLVNSVNPSSVPRACCVPTELSPISMLYLDEYDKVVLKNYQDMVVEGCGCR